MKRITSVFVTAAFIVWSTPAGAEDIIDEIRFGASTSIDSARSQDHGLVGSAEIYVAPFSSSKSGVAKVLLEPRIQVGISGGPSATDQIYTGLNWHVPITDTFFGEFGAGGTVHNGNLDSGAGPRLGCRLLFREHAALGIKVTGNVNVLATVDHSSNANLCDGPNDGLTHVGVALGVKF